LNRVAFKNDEIIETCQIFQLETSS